MRTIVPYVDASTETLRALVDAHEDFEAVYVGQDDEAYCRLLSHCWGARQDFAIVEQDIVVNPDTLEGFRSCLSPICYAPYPYLRGERYAGIGCVRFRGGLMTLLPDLMSKVAERFDQKHPKRHWCTQDAWIHRELAAARVRPCVDHATVGHLHVDPSHGCVPAQYLASAA